MTTIPRGLRNNNPLNIRHDKSKWKHQIDGHDKSFKTFDSMAWGYRAAFHLLNNYQRLHGCDTLRKMISRWAPPNENNTCGYIDRVAEWAGVSPDGRITATYRDVMVPVVAAMSQIENGVPARISDVQQGWVLFLANR